jgi:hypothetical protein
MCLRQLEVPLQGTKFLDQHDHQQWKRQTKQQEMQNDTQVQQAFQQQERAI